MSNETQTTWTTKIIIWSRPGNTPITNRGQQFCDELLRCEVQCADPQEARNEVKRLIRETKHADKGHFEMVNHPNQNTRYGFV